MRAGLAALLLAGCHTTAPAPTVEPIDAGEPCQTACTRYRQFGCDEGKPTPEGHACEEVCNNAASHGILLAGPGACSAAADGCEAIRKCAE